jgi:hypothetical protein
VETGEIAHFPGSAPPNGITNDPEPGTEPSGTQYPGPLIVADGMVGPWLRGEVLDADQAATLSPQRLEELLQAGALRPV